jgi:hypothetical protein
MTFGIHSKDFHRFLIVRDDFYSDPGHVRRIAQGMTFRERDAITGFMTDEVYHPPGVRRRLETILGLRINRWDTDPKEGNGIFFGGFSAGENKEVPGVHWDVPEDDMTVVVYLTPGIPPGFGTSLWQHKNTGLVKAPSRADARRLKRKLTSLRDRMESDTRRRDRWIETDRAGYRYNRMVAYPSAVLHSASAHYGENVLGGRIYQTFRIGVDWRTFKLQK